MRRITFGLLLSAFMLLTLAGQSLAQSSTIEKDNGKRWVIVPAMMTHLNAMDAALKEKPPATVAEHQKLGKRLDGSLSSLISSCTMTGKAHDELHKWLVPVITDIKGYSQGKDLKKLDQQHSDLRKAFLVFHQYFE